MLPMSRRDVILSLQKRVSSPFGADFHAYGYLIWSPHLQIRIAFDGCVHPRDGAGTRLATLYKPSVPSGEKVFSLLQQSKMQFSTVALALTAATAVTAANASNGSNHTNGSNHSSSSSKAGAVQVVGAGVFGVAAAAGVAMLI